MCDGIELEKCLFCSIHIKPVDLNKAPEELCPRFPQPQIPIQLRQIWEGTQLIFKKP